jgi:hypothetical protein
MKATPTYRVAVFNYLPDISRQAGEFDMQGRIVNRTLDFVLCRAGDMKFYRCLSADGVGLRYDDCCSTLFTQSDIPEEVIAWMNRLARVMSAGASLWGRR